MVFQTTYNPAMALALPGMPGDSQIAKDVISRILQQTNGVPFGVFVVRVDDQKCKLPVSAADVFLGVVRRDLWSAEVDAGMFPSGAPSNVAIPNKRSVPIQRLGRVWCITEEDVVEGGAVFVRIAAQGSLTQLGAARTTDDGTTAASTVRLSNARWAKSTAAGAGLVELLGAQTTAVGVTQT